MHPTLSRRSALRSTAAIGLTTTLAGPAISLVSAQTPASPEADEPFVLPDLAYGFDALEPHIDAETMEIHHDKHHATYVKNLNTAIADFSELQSMSVEDLIADLDSLPQGIRTAVRNNGGGHYNHSLFWEIIGPDQGMPSPELTAAIDRDLGGLEALQAAVTEAGTKRFGSGWAWVVASGGSLSVSSTQNQDNPLMDGSGIPILGIDVWEHAYYLKYRSARPDYLAAIWNVVNWNAVSEKFAASAG
jgi:Fe-Mn family superoxide dismutase